MRAVRRRRGLQLTRTTSSQAPVFDRELKLRHRARAAAKDAAGVAYLREAAAARVVGRLRDVAAREEKKNALDLGCGAGHLRAALEADAVDGDVAGGIATLAQCDAAPEAVAACALRAPAAGFATTAVVADEERSLPFDDASFDAVLSSGSLHWVNDLPGALREVRRVLRPDGVFIGALAGAGTLGELQYCRRPARGRGIERRRPGVRVAARAGLAAAEEERTGGVAPRCSPAARLADCGQLLHQAGFKLITVDVERVQVDFGDAFLLLDDLQRMGEQHAPLAPAPLGRDALLAAAAAYQHMFPAAGDATALRASFEMTFLIGWAPDDTPSVQRQGR